MSRELIAIIGFGIAILGTMLYEHHALRDEIHALRG